MTCTQCGRYADMDRETGYDHDALCPECEQQLEDNLENLDELLKENDTDNETPQDPTP